jgi:hypothetical protein
MSTPTDTDLLDLSPTRTITATRLYELTKENAVLIPLRHDYSSAAQAYRVDAQGGPYLMLSDEIARYRALVTASKKKAPALR